MAAFLFYTMPVTREKKQQVVKELKEKAAGSKALLLADFTGLSMKELKELRTSLAGVKAGFQVVKKTLFGLAVKDDSKALQDFLANFKGAVGVVFGRQDEVGAAKALWQFSQKRPKLKILAGFFGGKMQEATVIEALAKLPSLAELRAKLAWLLKSPAARLANAMQGGASKLAIILQNKGQAK